MPHHSVPYGGVQVINPWWVGAVVGYCTSLVETWSAGDRLAIAKAKARDLPAERRTGPMKALLVTALMLVNIQPSHAAYYTYSEWAGLPPNFRAVYVAGMYDALTSFATTDADIKSAVHYQNCISRAKMQNTQLAENMLAYAGSRPNLQSGGVTGAFINYLIELCGKPPQ
jgi:hypothetical protein